MSEQVSSKEQVGFEVDGVEAYRLEGGALEISEPVEDGYILIPATVADAFCKWAATLQPAPEPPAAPVVPSGADEIETAAVASALKLADGMAYNESSVGTALKRLAASWRRQEEANVYLREQLANYDRQYMTDRASSPPRACECLSVINTLIRPGDLQGNGCDETAQRNGVILAFNAVAEHQRSTLTKPVWTNEMVAAVERDAEALGQRMAMGKVSDETSAPLEPYQKCAIGNCCMRAIEGGYCEGHTARREVWPLPGDSESEPEVHR